MFDKRVLAWLALPGCLGAGTGHFDDEAGWDAGDGGADADTDSDSASEEPRLAPGIGVGDHSPGSVVLVPIAAELDYPTGLAFAPDSPSDLWVVNRDDDSWTIVDDVGTAEERARRYYDDSAHFLNAPTSLSFSSEESVLATCVENANDYNGLQIPDYWMGPVEWTSDRAVFSGGAMSHYDMAHEECYCMGIAWSEDHVFWTFNGNDSAIDRVDFHGFHPDGVGGSGLGGEDHTDGEIWRYAEGEIRRVEDVPSHMVRNPEDGYLYVNDTGNQRIVRLDTTPEDCPATLGNFTEMRMYACDRELEVVVAPGELTLPSGIALHDGLLYVTDFGEGTIKAFTTAGELVNWLDTGLGSGNLTGVAISSEGVVYFLDSEDSRLYRIDVVGAEG